MEERYKEQETNGGWDTRGTKEILKKKKKKRDERKREKKGRV